MNDEPRQAVFRPSRWPGWVWAVPIATLAIVCWLGVRSLMQQGPEVTVRFPTAGGLKPGSTAVKFQNMDVGEVESVHVLKDLRHIDVRLSFHSDMAGHLGPGTRYWVAGEQVSLSNLASLKSIVSGPFIAVDPRAGATVRHADGLSEPPALKDQVPGTSYTLHAPRLGSISPGTPIFFLGLRVGEVQSDRLDLQQRRFDIAIFVKAPYDTLVRDNTRFWNASPIHLAMAATGPSIELQSLPALVQGAIDFEIPPGPAAARAAEGGSFHLYPDKDTAENAPDSQGVAYAVVFDGEATNIPAGAPVQLQNSRIGTVRDSALDYDGASGHLQTRATIVIEPARLPIVDAGATPEDGRAAMDGVMRQLISRGLRAELARSAPVIGGEIVRLRFVQGASPATLGAGSPPDIPTVGTAGVDAIIAKAGDVMTRIDALPLAQIGAEVHDVTSRIAQLSASPRVAASLRSVQGSLANLDRVTADARQRVPAMLAAVHEAANRAAETLQSARTVLGNGGADENAVQTAGLPDTLYELTRAARSLRELSDYLDRHPEALLEGRGRGG